MASNESPLDEERTEQVDSVDLSADSPRIAGEGTLWCLEVVRGPNNTERIFLNEGVNSFGRTAECSVFLDDITVSRHHCDIMLENDHVSIKDQGSTNGTYVDSKALESLQQLEAGDTIQIGRYIFSLTRRSAK